MALPSITCPSSAVGHAGLGAGMPPVRGHAMMGAALLLEANNPSLLRKEAPLQTSSQVVEGAGMRGRLLLQRQRAHVSVMHLAAHPQGHVLAAGRSAQRPLHLLQVPRPQAQRAVGVVPVQGRRWQAGQVRAPCPCPCPAGRAAPTASQRHAASRPTGRPDVACSHPKTRSACNHALQLSTHKPSSAANPPQPALCAYTRACMHACMVMHGACAGTRRSC